MNCNSISSGFWFWIGKDLAQLAVGMVAVGFLILLFWLIERRKGR